MKSKHRIYGITGAKRFVFTVAVLLALTSLPLSSGVYAADTPSSGTTADDLKNNLSDVQDQLSTAQGEYDSAVKELKGLDASIKTLEGQIKDTQNDIDALQVQIDENNALLQSLLEQIVTLEAEITDQNSQLNKRLRVMYETGDQSILSVLLSSESFVDFLSNIEMVQRIHESDKAFLAELQTKLDDIEAKKAEAEQIQATLDTQNTELHDKQDKQNADKASLAAAQKRVQSIKDQAAADVDRLEKESVKIKNELANMTSQWGDYAGGQMAWPVIGPITSPFGMRIHPITGQYTMHTGIDIGVSSGTPVHAAADGIVYFAGWNTGGYGNLVMIDNGSGIVTMYAHNSSFAVSKGQVVSRGDVIAYSGSTGNSTGPHVHFEVRVNGVPQNPMNWLG